MACGALKDETLDKVALFPPLAHLVGIFQYRTHRAFSDTVNINAIFRPCKQHCDMLQHWQRVRCSKMWPSER